MGGGVSSSCCTIYKSLDRLIYLSGVGAADRKPNVGVDGIGYKPCRTIGKGHRDTAGVATTRANHEIPIRCAVRKMPAAGVGALQVHVGIAGQRPAENPGPTEVSRVDDVGVRSRGITPIIDVGQSSSCFGDVIRKQSSVVIANVGDGVADLDQPFGKERGVAGSVA